jgi:hypothetical protein
VENFIFFLFLQFEHQVLALPWLQAMTFLVTFLPFCKNKLGLNNMVQKKFEQNFIKFITFLVEDL